MPTPMALPFVNGSVLVAHRGLAGVTGNWYCGLHEQDEMGFALHLLRPGQLLVDVGANVGSYTILAAAGLKCEVVAFEPVPHTYALLQRNIAFNGVGERAVAHCRGISDRPGILRFTADLDAMNHVMADDEVGASIDVEVVTLDSMLEGRDPTLIKIDVEGHERAVIDGAVRLLSSPDLLGVIMETNASGERFGVGTDDLVAAMRGHGFEAYQYDAEHRVFRAAVGTANTIFVRDIDRVRGLCEAAPVATICNGVI